MILLAGGGMHRILTVCVFLVLTTVACERKPSTPQEKSETFSVPKVIVEKERAEREPPLPPEVKIRLKKDGKDNYSWELSGSDVDQILKVNQKLRKQLGGEKSQ